MKIVGICAAAMLLTSAAPAAPAPSADQDALCFLAMGEVLGNVRRLEGRSANGNEGADTMMRMLFFYGGVLRTRYAEAELAPVLKTALDEWRAMPTDARAGMVDCVESAEAKTLGVAQIVDRVDPRSSKRN